MCRNLLLQWDVFLVTQNSFQEVDVDIDDGGD